MGDRERERVKVKCLRVREKGERVKKVGREKDYKRKLGERKE